MAEVVTDLQSGKVLLSMIIFQGSMINHLRIIAVDIFSFYHQLLVYEIFHSSVQRHTTLLEMCCKDSLAAYDLLNMQIPLKILILRHFALISNAFLKNLNSCAFKEGFNL